MVLLEIHFLFQQRFQKTFAAKVSIREKRFSTIKTDNYHELQVYLKKLSLDHIDWLIGYTLVTS